MREIIQIPEALQDYIYLYKDVHLVQKKEIPEKLNGELEKLRVERNNLYNYPPHWSLYLMQPDELWRYEDFPIPDELKKYNTYHCMGGVRKWNEFGFVPPWLWGKLRKYKKAEHEWNMQREYKHYEACYANEITWSEYKKNHMLMLDFIKMQVIH